jgi:hypothetical protein
MKASKLIAAAFAIVLVACACSTSDGTDDVRGRIHNVVFEKNDPAAAGSMASQPIAEGSAANLSSNAFTKGSWEFKGWATSKDGPVAYADGAAFAMGEADATLYARWGRKFDISFFSQADARWGDDLMGTSLVDTITSSGTALTAVAMLLSTEDPAVTPKSLNAWLTVNGGYIIDDILIFAKIDDYPGSSYVYQARVPFTASALKAELDHGNPVIFSFGNGGQAYGVVLSYVGDGSDLAQFAYFKTFGTASEYALSAADGAAYIYPYRR